MANGIISNNIVGSTQFTTQTPSIKKGTKEGNLLLTIAITLNHSAKKMKKKEKIKIFLRNYIFS
jgi:hypothetical protein